MPEERLRLTQRSTYRVQRCRIRVAQSMPAYPWNLQFLQRRNKLTISEIRAGERPQISDTQ